MTGSILLGKRAMKPMAQAFCFLLVFFLTGLQSHETNASPYSKATRFLIDQQIKAGCDKRPGRFSHKGIFEIDLDGDKRLDLVLSHQGLHCEGNMGKSRLCGEQFCTILIYYRHGKQLEKKDEMNGYILSSRSSPEPVFDIATKSLSVLQWWPRRQVGP